MDGSDPPEIARIRTVSRLLDEVVRIPGTNIRIGLDPILGVLPVAGDSVAAVLSGYIILEGYRADAPPSLLAKMIALVAVDALIGSIPVLGTLFDVFWKANTWNVDLLVAHLESDSGRRHTPE
jgi:hypothetical protein